MPTSFRSGGFSEHVDWGFDRWLAEHDPKVAAKALIDAAQDIYLPSDGPSTYVDIDYAELLASLYLKGRAEQIKKGADHA